MARDGAGDARTAHHIEERYPLTPVQKGILFHSLLDEQSRAHVLQLVATFDEDVDAGEIEKAWRTASAAHPVLRTRFRVDGAEPEAELLAGATYNVERVEAGDINSFLEADRRRGLEPSHLPVMRFALVGARRLIWTFHHALLDSESALAILRDVVALMRGALPARPRFDESQPPSHDPHQSEAFWRETLRGFTAPTPLPGARVSRTHSPDFVERAVELGDLATRLRAFANTTEVDLETVIAGVWGMLLSRYSGEGDVVFGLARIRRPAGSTGMFIRTIPMRMTLPDKAVAIDSLRALQALRDTASEHEHIPLVRIQKLSEVSSGGSLFDSLLVFERRAPPDGVQVRIVGQTTYPLTLTADTESLAISIAYDRSHLDEAIVDSIPGHLRTMLAAVLDEPQSAIASVPILTEAERRRIVTEWNETASDYPRDRTIHSLIEEQAERTPDGVAVRFEGETLTYGELDRRANVIARKLRDAGVGPDTLVAIMMERSLSMIAALVGILKAGGAYVPLDPTYPKDRLAFMLEDSGAPVLVTDPALAPAPPREVQKVVIVENGPATEAATALPAVATPDNLAYVIYTSGSTGKPKGVQIPHRAVINFLESMRRVPGLTADDVLLGVTTLSFDICGLEMYLPLTTGACLELVSRTVAADGRRLAEELDRSGATVMQATPATWRMLIDAGWRGDKSLKILCGGEAMSGDLANALLDRCGSLWNMYGPTETTIWSTVHRVTRGEGATVPIGKPIANTQVYLLDSDLSPVPAGVAGELHIGGDGLARGYLNRPDLTAQRFIDWNGRRLYKTGDAARYRADGTLEYLHRLDNQVKLRGYRIELGEIESALRKCNGVADAVAVVADCGGAKVLAGYVIGDDNTPDVSDLRASLRESLPDYMVPSLFTFMDAFPLTPNGKVDRRALPPPERSERACDPAFVPPRDEIEQRLSKIWSDVLGMPEVGVADNFFELGGESILALRVFLQIEEAFGRKLPLATLFEAPTIEALACRIRNEGWSASWSPLVPIQPKGSRPPFFCVHGVGGNVLNYRPLAGYLGEDQPFYGLQSQGLDGKQPPLTKIADMAALYLKEVRRVQPRGPYHLGGASFGGVVAYEMAQQLRSLGEDVAIVALFDTNPVGYTRFVEADDEPTLSDSLARRLRVHLELIRRGPDRAAYLRKKVRRVWRKAVYRTWQTAFAAVESLHVPLPQLLHNVQKANYKALSDYQPNLYDGNVVLFCASGEPDAFNEEKKRGWSVLTGDRVEIHDVPGDHLTMIEEPHVKQLAERLRDALRSAEVMAFQLLNADLAHR